VIALLVLFSIETANVRVVSVDLIEINHAYTVAEDTGLAVPQYDQLIAWEWEVAEARHVVRFWRWLKDTGYGERKAAGYWACRMLEKGGFREVRAPVCRETWTVGDPEQEDRLRYGSKYRWATCESPY